jgi:hypothetical protein
MFYAPSNNLLFERFRDLKPDIRLTNKIMLLGQLLVNAG